MPAKKGTYQRRIRKVFTGSDSYNFDPITNDYVFNLTRTITPPVRIWPKGQIDPFQTWGGVYTDDRIDAVGNLIYSVNKFREQRFSGFEDVTVPYGTLKTLLKFVACGLMVGFLITGMFLKLAASNLKIFGTTAAKWKFMNWQKLTNFDDKKFKVLNTIGHARTFPE